jgi:hypothetical protein
MLGLDMLTAIMTDTRTRYQLHPLDDCFERVRRAGEHLEEMKRAIDEAVRRQANAVPIEYEADPPHRFKRQLPPETFYGMRISVLFGEVCYNLRSALDYLVYQLAELDSGSAQDGTQFPIVDAPEDFQRNAARWLRHISPAHVAAIERLQPYKGCDWTRRLRDCGNLDKYRKFVQHLGQSTITIHNGFETDLRRIIGAVPRRAIHPVHGEVDVKVHVSAKITLSDGSSVMEAMEEAHRGVAQTLAYFKPEF